MTTIEQLTLISQSPVSYNSEIRELAKCAASELEALQRDNDLLKRTLFDKEATIERQFNTIKSQSGSGLTKELSQLRAQNRELKEALRIICATNFLDRETIFHFEQRVHLIAAQAIALKT